MNVPQVAVSRSRDEIADAILAFTPADFARLRLVAKKYGYCHNMSDEDLLHEAVHSFGRRSDIAHRVIAPGAHDFQVE